MLFTLLYCLSTFCYCFSSISYIKKRIHAANQEQGIFWYSKLFDISKFNELVVSQVYLQEKIPEVDIFIGMPKSEQGPFD